MFLFEEENQIQKHELLKKINWKAAEEKKNLHLTGQLKRGKRKSEIL